MCSFRTLYLLYELGYYTISVLISIADPVLDLVVGFSYLANGDKVFGIATLCLCFLPTLLMSALSFQWVVYDSTLESMLKNLMTQDRYRVPCDYTRHFKKKGAPVPLDEQEADISSIGGKATYHRLNFVTYNNYEDVEFHPPENECEIEVDNGTPENRTENETENRTENETENRTGNETENRSHTDTTNNTTQSKTTVTFNRNTPSRASKWRARAERDQSSISVDAGLSRYPLIITGTTLDVNGNSEIVSNVLAVPPEEASKITDENKTADKINKRKRVFKETCKQLKIDSKVKLENVRGVEVVFHLLGLPGITRYGSLLLHAVRSYRNREGLTEKYDLFVKEAAERGIKEVYFNTDLSEKFRGRRDAALLRLVEGALESTPQLLLQLYIIVKYTMWNTSPFTYLSVVVSFTSVVWSMTSYIYEHRAASYDKASMDMYGYILNVLIKLFMCVSRITAILLAATYSGYLVLAVLIVHWLSCLIYVCHANTHFYGGLVYKEWFFKLIASITLVLTFMNIVEGHSFTRWCAYHGFTLIQNLLMLLLWYFHWYSDPSDPDFYGIMLICMVIGGTVMGSLLTIIYYQLFHPSRKFVLEISKCGAILEELRVKYTSRTSNFETSL